MTRPRETPLRARANLRFRTPEEGGRRVPIESGVRSQFRACAMLTSCSVWARDGSLTIPSGADCDVTIAFQFWDACQSLVREGMPVELCEGSRVVATGVLVALEPE